MFNHNLSSMLSWFTNFHLRKQKKSFFTIVLFLQVNPRMYNGFGGGGEQWMPLSSPIRFFSVVILEDKTSAPDVFSRCSFIPRAHFEISWVMVSCYGYEIWRHKSHFWVKVHVFSTFLTIKVIYLCVIFPVQRKRLPFLTVLTWFIVIVKMQDGGQDGDHCWWRHRPPATPPPIKYTSFC